MTHYPFKAEPIESFPDLPPDSYISEIIKTDVMTTKDGQGRYIKIRFKIKEGEFKGRIIYQNFNILNKNKIAEEIGKRYLSILCTAIGIESFDDTDEILNYQVIVKLGAENKLLTFYKIEEKIPSFEEPPIIAPDDFVDDKIPF